MRSTIRLTSAVGGLMLLGISGIAGAQSSMPQVRPAPGAVSAPGSVQGIVTDERGTPMASVAVSAIGAQATLSTVTDRLGHFELRALPPGGYFLHATAQGYAPFGPKGVDVRASAGTSFLVSLHRMETPSAPVLAAGLGVPVEAQAVARTEPSDPSARSMDGDSVADPGETAWRLRHARRSILKDASLAGLLTDLSGAAPKTSRPYLDLAGGSMHLASSFFADTPFSGQVNFLTTGSWEAPRDLFSTNSLARGITFVSLSSPAGNGDWTVRGALTQSDISAWVVAGSYVTRPSTTSDDRRGFGLSYSTQRYEGGNLLTLREVRDGSRNVGEIFGYETRALSPAVSVTYGGRYAQYDYMQGRNVISPYVELVLRPDEHLRISGGVTRGARAPGAEEFLPPSDSGIWLPPQRTFSALEPGRPLTPEQTLAGNVAVERTFGTTTVGVRAFHQQVSDQLMTLFGTDIPGEPSAQVGHYLVGSAGDAKATGAAASVKKTFARRIHGRVEYSLADARLRVADDLRYIVLMPPSIVRPRAEHLHDVAASVEAEVPETSTRVMVLYRVGNGFVQASPALERVTATRRALDSRFDVQVRQSLPFMDFRTSRWEMLVTVRNFFSETASGQSVYDELLVVRPPKRIVGGLTMMF